MHDACDICFLYDLMYHLSHLYHYYITTILHGRHLDISLGPRLEAGQRGERRGRRRPRHAPGPVAAEEQVAEAVERRGGEDDLQGRQGVPGGQDGAQAHALGQGGPAHEA